MRSIEFLVNTLRAAVNAIESATVAPHGSVWFKLKHEKAYSLGVERPEILDETIAFAKRQHREAIDHGMPEPTFENDLYGGIRMTFRERMTQGRHVVCRCVHMGNSPSIYGHEGTERVRLEDWRQARAFLRTNVLKSLAAGSLSKR